MIKCGDDCVVCCDFCMHAIHEIFEINGRTEKGGPIGCMFHADQEHQNIAEGCGHCDDFHCFLTQQE